MTVTYILEDSPRKNKRYRITMKDHFHDFAAKNGKTFIDGRTERERSAWIARHRKDRNWDSNHSAIYHSRWLLWTEPTLSKAIKRYEKKHNVKIINKTSNK